MTFHHPSGRKVRASDIVVAGHRGDAETVRRAVDHEDHRVRTAAIGALLRVDELDAATWQTFVVDEHPAVRRRAAEVAPRIADALATETHLVQLLDDNDEIAEVAAFALGEVGSAPERTLGRASIDQLERVVKDHDDALCREAAVASLGALHEGLATILHACRDKATVRRRAIIALAPFEGPEVTAALQRALEDRDWQVRQAAEDLLAIEADDVDESDDDV